MAIDLATLPTVHDHPPRVLLLGGRGVGKTTIATSTPNPFFMNLEKSRISRDLGLGHQTPETYAEVLDLIDSLQMQEHNYQTLVIDTVDKLEMLLTEYICQTHGYNNIAQTKWGEGLSFRTTEWIRFLGLLDDLNSKRGMFIILIAHSTVVKVEEPMLPDYDMHTLKLYKRDGPIIADWVDIIGYCRIKTYTTKDGERNLAQTAGEREICCQPNPSYEAKTRYLGIPNEITMSWDLLLEYMRNGSYVQTDEQNKKEN